MFTFVLYKSLEKLFTCLENKYNITLLFFQDNSERSVVIRTGITSSDLSGKTWQTISAPLNFGQETYGNPTYITSQHRILPEFDDTSSASNRDDNSKSNVTEGSSNENFKSFGSRITNSAASSAAATATRMAVGATVGRIPVAGNFFREINFTKFS